MAGYSLHCVRVFACEPVVWINPLTGIRLYPRLARAPNLIKSMPKPTLVLHPGFPKCATSYIQRLFVQKEYALSRALGVRAIGRDFKPENGYPDVTKAMYNYSAFLEIGRAHV